MDKKSADNSPDDRNQPVESEGKAAARADDLPSAGADSPGASELSFSYDPPGAVKGDTNVQALGAVEAPDSQSQLSVTMLGDFLLMKKLGQGGMGTVYQAHQVGLDRDVAIKVLASHLASDPKFLERFEREARVMGKLDHVNILRCFAVGEAHGYHYLAMELAAAGSLEDWVQSLGQLNVGDSLNVIMAAAAGLQHAHDQNLVHRDIKPGNILITSKGVVKVSDLGLAKALTEEDLTLTRSGTGIGTPVYMPLEQMRDAKSVDWRSDIYALGCMLYRCLTGRPPFEGENYIELYEAKEKGKYPPPRRFNKDVPRRLEFIIDRLLEKNPKDRYQNCGELIADLDSLGLASATLSFISDAAPQAPMRRVPTKPPSTASSSTSATPKPRSLAEPEWWYIRANTFEGVRRLNRKQVVDLIQALDFDFKALASRSEHGAFQPLKSFPEFAPTIRARSAKVYLDQKATRYKNQYAAILKEEADYQQEQANTINLRRFAVWIGPLIGLAVLSGLGYFAYWAIKTFILGK